MVLFIFMIIFLFIRVMKYKSKLKNRSKVFGKKLFFVCFYFILYIFILVYDNFLLGIIIVIPLIYFNNHIIGIIESKIIDNIIERGNAYFLKRNYRFALHEYNQVSITFVYKNIADCYEVQNKIKAAMDIYNKAIFEHINNFIGKKTWKNFDEKLIRMQEDYANFLYRNNLINECRNICNDILEFSNNNAIKELKLKCAWHLILSFNFTLWSQIHLDAEFKYRGIISN